MHAIATKQYFMQKMVRAGFRVFLICQRAVDITETNSLHIYLIDLKLITGTTAFHVAVVFKNLFFKCHHST